MNKISTYIQHMASCRDINDCTDVSCASQHCTDVARNISADFKLYRRAMARLNIEH